ncbi:hypothetical protein LTS18_014374, partial [Coniosporium uncinatum]
MAPSPQLSDPGSSSYDSSTMYVGDGTWDTQRNTFLLPNLQGYNLATTQINGMANRFRDVAGYRPIIKAHGILAGITFLAIVPAAIMIARFYNRNPRTALRLHIWLQLLTVMLATVIFILGYMAVGLPRSLANPHHGIGTALYILILVQIIGGSLIHHTEKKKAHLRSRVPLKLILHQWLGRAIALLGITQVALGMDLYGSPKVLFILYAIAGAILLITYFVLDYRQRPYLPGADDRGSYVSGSGVEEHSQGRHRGLKTLAGLGAAGAGVAALRHRNKSRSQSRRRSDSRQKVLSSRRSSRRRSGESPEDSIVDEKYSDAGHGGEQHTWRNRLLGGAAAGGTFAAVRSFFNRRRGGDEDSDNGSYNHPLGGS